VTNMPQVFVPWSGGKDSCFACYLATINGLKVRYLANMITEDAKRSWSHGLSAELLQVQAQAIGIPLVQRQVTRHNYDAEFKNMLLAFKQEGIDGAVFGDIAFIGHQQWIEKACHKVNLTPHFPLSGQAQEKVLRDFIDLGFEATIVVTKADLIGEQWLGRKVDLGFLSYLSELGQTNDIHICGEAGEYHTFVTDGPLFNQRIEILETNKILRERHWYLDILKYDLRAK